jgi:ribosomal protein S18 acetylase RimI-like enzyme
MRHIKLRPAREGDAPAIATIHVTSWRDAYAGILDPDFLSGPIETERLDLWVKRLRDPVPGQIVQVAENEEEAAIGFVCAFRNVDPVWGSIIDNLHVVPRLRGHGVGDKLLRSMASLLESQGTVGGLHLWVFSSNTAALRFYQRLGGRVVGQDVSRIPQANGRLALRVHWPMLRAVGGG